MAGKEGRELAPNIFECSKGSVSFLDQIPLFNFNTSYWGTWRSGLQQGLEKRFEYLDILPHI